MRRMFLIFVFLASSNTAVWAQDPPDGPPAFNITRAFLENLGAQKTFLPTYKIRMEHRSRVKSLTEDCEVHLAGFFQESFEFGEPAAVVVEPPNLCKFRPNGNNPSTSSLATLRGIWHPRLDNDVLNENCEVTGFPRIFTEHLTADPNDAPPSNPNHVFEIHPTTRIACAGVQALDFIKNLRSFPTLRHIQASSAHTCITGLKLWVRYHEQEDHYEFAQQRPGVCGNLAIVEVTSVPREWIQATPGGHTAIARITTNGADDLTLKLYAIEGSAANDWLARVKAGKPQLNDPRLVHGIFTYDFFSIVRAIGDSGGVLGKPDQWREVRFPLAFVLLGGTETVP